MTTNREISAEVYSLFNNCFFKNLSISTITAIAYVTAQEQQLFSKPSNFCCEKFNHLQFTTQSNVQLHYKNTHNVTHNEHKSKNTFTINKPKS